MLIYSEMKCKWNEITSDKTFNKPLGSTLHSLLEDASLSVSVIISLWCEGWCKHMRALTALCVKDINMVLHYYWETVSHTLIMSVSLYINTLRLNDFDMFKNRCDYKEHASGSVYSTVNVCLWKWLRWSNLSDGWTASEALRSHFCHQLSDSFGVWPSCGPHLLLSVGCFTLIDDVGSRWVWLLQSDSRATWYGMDVRCVVTQFIWVFSGPQNTCNWAQSAKTSRRGPDVPAVWCVCRCVSVLATCCLFLVTAFFVYLRLFLLPLVFLHVVL